MNVLIDSSGWIEYFSNGKNASRYLVFIEKASKKNCLTPTIIIYEVYKKIKKEFGESKANQVIAQIVDCSQLVELDERIALHAAEISLQSGLAMADAIIKATADLNGCRLITGDHHFKGLENVQVIE